ncbi:MAG: hypothetical protein Q9207_005095 [Kuettlingeria erythrocarpa]
MSGGWSARGGQTQSAYVRGGVVDDGIFGHSNPSGSSTGSAVGVSAGFAPVSIGADFNGSLTNPAIRAALYTLRTTPGTVSEDGGFPFSVDRDSIGPMAKSTEDMANLLNVIADSSHPNVPQNGYGKSPGRPWKDISVATLDPNRWLLPEEVQKPQPGALDQIIRETLSAYNKLTSVARKVVPIDLIAEDVLSENFADVMKLITNDFSRLLKTYINGLETPKVSSLSELIAFNENHRDLELPPACPGQEKLIQSEKDANHLSEEEYKRLDEKVAAAAGEHGINKALREHGVDVIIGPADSRVPDVVALARYPSVTLPLGYLDWNGRPFGLLAITSRFQEELLLDVARAWEATFPPRQPPPVHESQ